MHTRNQIFQNFDPIARRLTKIKPKEIFKNFAISRELIDEFASNFKQLDQIARRLPKLEPKESPDYNFLVFKLNNQINIC